MMLNIVLNIVLKLFQQTIYCKEAGVGHKLDTFDLALGYRHLRWDFNDGAPLQHLYVTGPMVGIKYWF